MNVTTGNAFSEQLQRGAFPVGPIVTLDVPEVAELLSGCGYDFLLFDMEHSALSVQSTQHLMLAARDDCATLVRIPENANVWIKKVLDTGCNGIVVPMVNSPREAEQVVRASNYPPKGTRSVGISRAHGYGGGFQDYVETANQRVSVIIQIEHIVAVDCVVDIVSVAGIDAVMIGPYDLSASMGLLGQVDHRDVQDAISRTRVACNDANVPVGIFAMSPEQVPGFRSQGFQFAVVGIDSVMLGNVARSAVGTAREKRGEN